MGLMKIDSRYYINVAKLMHQKRLLDNIIVYDNEVLPIISVETEI